MGNELSPKVFAALVANAGHPLAAGAVSRRNVNTFDAWSTLQKCGCHLLDGIVAGLFAGWAFRNLVLPIQE